MATEKTEGFDRDFGYLMPFFDKVTAAASAVQEPAAREELSRLLNGEKAKWERIRALLGGAAAARPPGRPGEPAPARPAAAPVAELAGPADGALTVGSLRRRR